MSILYGLLAIAVFLLGWPYFRCFFKRVTCMRKLKKVCRTKGYQLHKTHFFWFLGHKNAKKCDFYIETRNQVFAVKLFGMPNRRTVLIFKENGEYMIRRFTAFISYGSAVRFPIDSKPRKMPTYHFRYRYRDAWEIKTPRQVLLVNPVSMEFRRTPSHGKEILLGAGEVVCGMEIDSLPRLLADLESAL